MASPAAVLSILITANSTQANAQLAKTQATLQRTTATANTASTAVGTRLAGAAKMGAAAVGVGLVYGLGKAVAAGANFEKQMDSVGAVADANTKQMKRLEKQALSLGQKTQYSAQEVAQAQEALVKGGLKLKDVLGGALPASLSLAAAGQMELADASATTVNAMKLFGLEGNKAMQVADMLATAANKTTADVSDFAMALQQGGSAAKAAGYDLNDTITILEALAEVGIKNSDAGTSMKTAFLQLLAPTSKQAELAKKLNLEFVDQNGNLKDAAALSKELHGALDGMTKSQQAANLKLLAGTDGFRTLNALLAQTPDKFKELNDANAENGTANDIAAKKMDNLAGSAEQLSGAVQTLAIKVSKWINPKLRDAIDWMTQALNDLDKVGPGAAFGKTTLKATDVLFRDLNNITDDGLYDIVAKWSAQGKTITKDQVTHWLRLNKISAEQADRLFRTIDRFNQNSEDSFRLLAGYMRGTVTPGIKVFSTKTAGFLDEWSHKGQDDIDDLQKALKKLDDAYEKTGDKTKTATDKMAEAGERMAKSLKSSTNNVTGSFNSMVNATANGLSVMGKNVKNALDAVGVKKAVSFSIEKVGNAAKGFQTGGVIVPGQGDGDKVPALLEPGEVVLNKKAVAAMGGASRANSINQKIPRFQKGGAVGSMSAMTSLVNKYEREHYPYLWGGGHGGFVNGASPVDCSGFVSDVLHAGGLLNGAPMVSGALMNWGKPAKGNEPLVVYANPVHTVMSLNGKVAGTSGTNPGGGAGWIEGGSGARLAPGAMRTMDVAGFASRIARLLLKGPDGPLKNIGQGALDKVRNAANKFIESKQPMGSVGGGDMGPLGKALVTGRATWFTGGQMASGKNTDTDPGIALNPNPGGPDPGSWNNPTTQRWLADAQQFLVKIGGKQTALPVLDMGPAGWTGNAIDVDLAGVKALGYSTSNFPSGTVGTAQAIKAQMGGIIQHFAKGGKAKKDLHGTVGHGSSDPAWRRFMRARNIAKRLSGILGDKGRVAQIDERISMAETLASLDSSEMGSDLSPAELAKQIDLNERLLEVLTRAKKLSRSGLKELNFPKSMSTTAVGKGQLRSLRGVFGGYLTDLTGVTGKGGRIFDTMVHLDALRNTSTGSVAAMDISQLRSVIEASRYGVFDSLPKFHTGGVVPGAPSQEVPIMARGGEVVSPGGQTFVGVAYIDLGDGVTQRVEMEFKKQDRKRYQDTRAGVGR